MLVGDKILYRLTGKKFWKRGTIMEFPAEGLITIERQQEELDVQANGRFTASVVDLEMIVERPDVA